MDTLLFLILLFSRNKRLSAEGLTKYLFIFLFALKYQRFSKLQTHSSFSTLWSLTLDTYTTRMVNIHSTQSSHHSNSTHMNIAQYEALIPLVLNSTNIYYTRHLFHSRILHSYYIQHLFHSNSSLIHSTQHLFHSAFIPLCIYSTTTHNTHIHYTQHLFLSIVFIFLSEFLIIPDIISWLNSN